MLDGNLSASQVGSPTKVTKTDSNHANAKSFSPFYRVLSHLKKTSNLKRFQKGPPKLLYNGSTLINRVYIEHECIDFQDDKQVET